MPVAHEAARPIDRVTGAAGRPVTDHERLAGRAEAVESRAGLDQRIGVLGRRPGRCPRVARRLWSPRVIAIIFNGGPLAGQRLELDREMTFGRSGCDVLLEDPEVSRRHVRLRPVGDELHAEDLGSSNGTLVNGHVIDGTVSVEHGGDPRGFLRVDRGADRARGARGHAVGADHVATGQEFRSTAGGRSAPRAGGRSAPRARCCRTRPPGTGRGGYCQGWLWSVIGLAEVALILTAAVVLVYYAVG